MFVNITQKTAKNFLEKWRYSLAFHGKIYDVQAAMTFDDGEASFKDQMRRALNFAEEVEPPKNQVAANSHHIESDLTDGTTSDARK